MQFQARHFRKLHRKIAPVLFLPLLLSAVTGVLFRLGRNWWELPNEVTGWMMAIHQGEYLGSSLSPIYVLLVGLGLLGLVISGLSMLKVKHQLTQHPSKRNLRWIHHSVAAIAFLPLVVSATTGITYRLGQTWFGLPLEQTAIVLQLHQGSYLGEQLKVFYVLLVGLGLVTLLITGIQMTGIFRRST
jgi:hypothetical protein